MEQAIELDFRKEKNLELHNDGQQKDATTTSAVAPGVNPATCFPTELTGLWNVVASPQRAGCPALIMGDITRLRQVAVNIISNACKFTPAGGAVRVALGVA